MPMPKNEAFKKLLSILASSEVISEDHFVVIKLKNNSDENGKNRIREIISNCGYLKTDDPFEGDRTIWLDKRTTNWSDGDCQFYSNKETLWQRCYQSDSLPDIFYVIEDKLSHLDVDSDLTLIKFNIYFAWKKLLLNLSDHCTNDYFIFFMINDKAGDKIEINSTIDISQLPSITNPKLHLELVNELQDKIDFKDLHTLERRSVMRATISEVINESNNREERLQLLLSITVLFNKKYNELYEIYTKRFSVNKLLNELDEKSLEFTSKINEFISSSQTKALTIPGALIAVGALAKVDAPLEAFIILGGLWMIRKVNISSNQVYRDAFSALDNRLSNAFSKYLKFHSELEVKESAEAIKIELSILINTSKDRLKVLDRLANAMYYGGLAYIMLKLVNKEPYKSAIHQVWLALCS